MYEKKKTIIVFILFAILLFMILAVTFALHFKNKYPYSINFPQVSGDYEQFFGVEKKKLKGTANCSYTISNMTDSQCVVNIDFTVRISGKDFNGKAEGIVEVIKVDDDILINGPLHGEFSVNGKEYDTIVGFRKFLNGDSIQISVTVMADHTISFSFASPTFYNPIIETAQNE